MIHLPGMRPDYLSLNLSSRVEEFGHYERHLDTLLDLIDQHAGELAPDHIYHGKRRLRYSRANARKRLDKEAERYKSSTVYLGKDGEVEAHFSLSFARAIRSSGVGFVFALKVHPLSFYADSTRVEERVSSLLSLVRALASYVPFTYGNAHALHDFSDLGEYPYWWTTTPLQSHRISQAHWLELFGKGVVDAFGREHVLKTPAAHREELPNGSILFLTSPSPADFRFDASRVAQARFLSHLRPDLAYDAILAQLRERSAAFAPIEAHFDPDIAPLLLSHLRTVDKLKRRQEIERLNTWSPPPVTEWMPLKDAPPANAANPEQTLQLIDRVVRYLSIKVIPKREEPEKVLGAGLVGVNALDVWLWETVFATYGSEHKFKDVLVPTVGSHLGQLLVRDMGGRWVLRSTLEECYVALGQRAWFPFERVKRFMPSREAMVEHSLSKFYAEAMRYAQSFHAQA